jgi:hypothetical protein
MLVNISGKNNEVMSIKVVVEVAFNSCEHVCLNLFFLLFFILIEFRAHMPGEHHHQHHRDTVHEYRELPGHIHPLLVKEGVKKAVQLR